MGAASLFFALGPTEAVLSDVNEDLVNAFRVVSENPTELRRLLDEYPERDRDLYYDLRALVPADLDSLTQAARFIYLNRFSFNGVHRTNRQGVFNVPFAADKTGGLPSAEHLRACARALRNATVLHSDFEEITDSAGESDFLYLDPPYVTSSRRTFSEYHPRAFTVDDLPRLAESLRRADGRGVRFLLSYLDCEEADEHFGEWQILRHQTATSVAADTDYRTIQGEVLVHNMGDLSRAS